MAAPDERDTMYQLTDTDLRNAQAALIDEARAADALECPRMAAQARAEAAQIGRELRRRQDAADTLAILYSAPLSA